MTFFGGVMLAFVLSVSVLLFGSVDSADSAIGPTEGFILIPWTAAPEYLDDYVVVHGRIHKVSPTRYRTYLNFSEDIENDLSISVDAKFLDNFKEPLDHLYEGRTIFIAGRLDGEIGKPQMRLQNSSEIRAAPDSLEDVFAFGSKHFPGIIRPEVRKNAAKPLPDRVRVATYNVYNMFDEHDDPFRADEGTVAAPEIS